MIILNKDQEIAVRTALEFDNHPTFRKMLMKGSAGTGKTTIIGEYTRESNKQCLLCAPTHKAKNVLAKKAVGFEVTTIHSLLGLVPEWKNGKTILVQKAKPKTGGGALTTIVVDEASMLTDEMHEYINSDIRQNKTRYILSGDHCQLGPQDDDAFKLSKTFSEHDVSVNLSEIVRQAKGSPIIRVATGFRNIIETGNISDIEFDSNELGSVQMIDKRELIHLSKELYLSKEYEDDPDFVKIISFTNESCHKYNHFINKLFNVPDNESFIVGSKVYFNEAWVKGQKQIVGNNTEGIVTNIKKCIRDGIWFDKLTIKFDADAPVLNGYNEFDVVCNSSRADYNKFLDQLKRNAIANNNLWGKYYGYKNQFADVRCNHTITSFKSQGSEFVNVIIDLGDMMKCKKPAVWHHLYTSLTRTKQNCWIME